MKLNPRTTSLSFQPDIDSDAASFRTLQFSSTGEPSLSKMVDLSCDVLVVTVCFIVEPKNCSTSCIRLDAQGGWPRPTSTGASQLSLRRGSNLLFGLDLTPFSDQKPIKAEAHRLNPSIQFVQPLFRSSFDLVRALIITRVYKRKPRIVPEDHILFAGTVETGF